MIGGMVIVGVGAGLLNGETTKVGMAVIPRERSGMASGISGTVRFTGLVVGIAALGAILYDRVAVSVANALPKVSAADQATLVHDITAGNLSGATLAGYDASSLRELAVASFASGYRALFLAGALFTLVSAVLASRLVSPAETPPVPPSSARSQSKPL
jgi:hypothetical protein